MSKAREEAEKWLTKLDTHKAKYESEAVIENLLTELSQYQKVVDAAEEFINDGKTKNIFKLKEALSKLKEE